MPPCRVLVCEFVPPVPPPEIDSGDNYSFWGRLCRSVHASFLPLEIESGGKKTMEMATEEATIQIAVNYCHVCNRLKAQFSKICDASQLL